MNHKVEAYREGMLMLTLWFNSRENAEAALNRMLKATVSCSYMLVIK